MKDLKSNDGDAASPLEKMSNGRISRSMITTELQNFVPVGQLCHVKAQSKSKGSNLVCRSELAVAIGMVSGVVKWMDVTCKRPRQGSGRMTGNRSTILRAYHGRSFVDCLRSQQLCLWIGRLIRKSSKATVCELSTFMKLAQTHATNESTQT